MRKRKHFFPVFIEFGSTSVECMLNRPADESFATLWNDVFQSWMLQMVYQRPLHFEYFLTQDDGDIHIMFPQLSTPLPFRQMKQKQATICSCCKMPISMTYVFTASERIHEIWNAYPHALLPALARSMHFLVFAGTPELIGSSRMTVQRQTHEDALLRSITVQIEW